ncbi:MAG TPA: hypothetical protein VG096_07405 [Bryobacteraceae bacterium]|nr:hypothetical protein [Bryobacteraceae bacterium]
MILYPARLLLAIPALLLWIAHWILCAESKEDRAGDREMRWYPNW